MKLKGVHFLLTYKCDLECDHCFVWGSPDAKGTFTIDQMRNILAEAAKLGTVNCVSVEGGEPFLYYPVVIETVKEAVRLGSHVEIITNCYWATCEKDAIEWLRPIAEAENVELSLSSDLYHRDEWETELVRNAAKAAKKLNVKVGVIAVKKQDADSPCPKEIEGARVDLWELMHRGRATLELAKKVTKKPWTEFTKCPYEDFANQTRVHVDPLGYVRVCQGIAIGNAWQKPFSQVIREYDPNGNSVLEPLVHGGPAELIAKHDLPCKGDWADACHLCYAARVLLRDKYPDILAPKQMYGELSSSGEAIRAYAAYD